jgi:RecA/RadA recombinase
MTVAEKEKILENKKNKKVEKEVKRFHTGDWTLDCILSNGSESEKGFPIGKVVHLWGGSKSGKSFLCLNAIREMLAIYGFKGADYLWLDVEQAFSFDTEELFGFPINDSEHIASPKTIAQWQATIETFAANNDPKKPKILVLDSLDTLTTIEELARMEDRVKNFKKSKGKDTGEQKTYGMEKAKRIGEVMRTSLSTIQDNNITMFVISQERMNVNKKSLYDKETVVSGGKAKDYYATVQLQVKPVEIYGEKFRETGSCVQILGAKTRTPYEGRRSLVSLFYNMGFDPIGSGVDALYDLRDEYGKLIPAKASAIKWDEEFDLNSLGGEAVADAEIKAFAKDLDIEQAVRDEYGSLRVKNISLYISATPEIRNEFVEKFGVMSRDDLIAWIEEDENREAELERRVKAKFYHTEENLTPKRKSRKLIA